MPITNKTKMYELLQRGKLGNALRTWNSEADYLASGFKGRSSLRCKKPGVTFRHGMTHAETIRQGRLCFEGCQPGDFIYCESAPDWLCIFQGEVRRGLHGLDLRWSTERTDLRTALRNAKEVNGVRALVLLQHFLDPRDYDELMSLLDAYEDHVVEFSVFGCPVGELGRTMCIWECRAY